MTDSLRQWQRVQALCEAAEHLPPEQLDAFLLGEPDPAIRAEALAILKALAAEQALRFSLRAASAPSSAAAAQPPVDVIGPYQVLEVAGSGGFGDVYRAVGETNGIRREVAVKLIRGSAVGDEGLSRFERERKLLGALDDSRIARYLDTGRTSSGLPYLVMEYVPGQPITSYCDQHQLSLRQRVLLVAQVAEAVQHAHQRLVVHLDLKPSNILVKEDGSIKLLDFGTAKLLSSAAHATSTKQITPAYASPERLRGDPVSVTCDVYSLGLILFELASGSWPFASRDSFLSVAERASGSVDAAPLSRSVTEDAARLRRVSPAALRRLLQGDLEAICAKALSYHPDARYPTAEAFLQDLRRYLAQQPVLARPQTRFYRIAKYLARHRRAALISALACATVLSLSAYAWTQQQQRIEAGRQAEAVASLLSWAISSSNPLYGGRSGLTVVELAQRASARLSASPEVPAPVRARLQSVFAGFLHQEGRGEAAERIALEALQAAQQTNDPNSLLGLRLLLASFASGKGDCANAVRELQLADAIFESSSRRLPPFLQAVYILNRSEAKTYCENDAQGAKALMARLPILLEQIPDDDLTLGMPPRIFKAIVANHQAQDLRIQGRLDEAERLAQEALAKAEVDPQAGNARIALYRTLSAIRLERNGPNDLQASAQALEAALQLAPGFTSTYERLRLHTMLAVALARAGDSPRSRQAALQALAEARSRESELAGQAWMIDVNAAYALAVWADDCSQVPGILRHARDTSRGTMSPSWRWQYLAAEGACLVQGGNAALGTQRLQEAINVGSLRPGTAVRQRLEGLIAR